MHVEKYLRDVVSVFVNLGSQFLHGDVDGLGACGVRAVRLEEADNALAEGERRGAPASVNGFLGKRGEDVVEVELEDEVFFCQAQHVFLAYGDEVEVGDGDDGARIGGMEAEEVFGMDEQRGVEGLGDAVAAAV